MANNIISLLARNGLTLSVAESCTGGLICHKLTQTPGASNVLKEGIVCYSNSSKTRRLGVPAGLLKKYGAVSPQACRLMAKNIRAGQPPCGAVIRSRRSGRGAHLKSDIGLAVTGIAGPDGGTKAKPVGLVYIGLAYKLVGGPTGVSYDSPANRGRSRVVIRRFIFKGSRSRIKNQSARTALGMLAQLVYGKFR